MCNLELQFEPNVCEIKSLLLMHKPAYGNFKRFSNTGVLAYM